MTFTTIVSCKFGHCHVASNSWVLRTVEKYVEEWSWNTLSVYWPSDYKRGQLPLVSEHSFGAPWKAAAIIGGWSGWHFAARKHLGMHVFLMHIFCTYMTQVALTLKTFGTFFVFYLSIFTALNTLALQLVSGSVTLFMIVSYTKYNQFILISTLLA